MPYNEDKTYFNNHKIFIKDDYECIMNDEGKFKYVHRLIMEEYLDRTLETNEIVHHKDEDKRHNEVSNFELKDSITHAKHHSTPDTPLSVGSLNGQAKLNEEKVIEIIPKLTGRDVIQEVANEYNVHYTTIWDIWKNRTWTHVLRN